MDRTIDAGPIAERTTSARHRIDSGTAPAVKSGPKSSRAKGAPMATRPNRPSDTRLAARLASPTLR
ncbi:hypothetical protein D3C87_1975500 [compost metagenome]